MFFKRGDNDFGNDQVQRRQRLWLIIGMTILFVAFAAIVFLPGWNNKAKTPPPEKVKQTPVAHPGGKVSDQELWRAQSEALLRSMNDRMSKLETDLKAKDSEISSLKEQKQQPEKFSRADDAASVMLKKPLPLSTAAAPVPPPVGMPPAVPEPPPSRQLITVTRQVPAGETAAPTKADRPLLTTSSFVRALSLSGLDAPTGGQAQGDPLPIFFEITDSASLPNRYRSQIKQCRVMGVGWGDLPSSRAYIRLEQLSCLLTNGRYVDVKVKGRVLGEDGKDGMRGRLVSKQGQMIANGILAGVASGIGQGFSAKYTTTSIGAGGAIATVSGDDVWRSGVGQGVANGMDMLAQYYIKAAEKLYPVIEVDSARKVDLAFTQPVVIPGLADEDYRGLVNRSAYSH